MRIMPASDGCASTVPPRTYRSYCSVTQRRDARLGEPAMRRISARRSVGRARFSGPAAISASWSAGRSMGRW
jgi:hypothetical protein